MSETFIVEIWGKPVGIVLREGETFRFHATSSPFFRLHGATFSKPGHARLAAARLDREDEAGTGGARSSVH